MEFAWRVRLRLESGKKLTFWDFLVGVCTFCEYHIDSITLSSGYDYMACKDADAWNWNGNNFVASSQAILDKNFAVQ